MEYSAVSDAKREQSFLESEFLYSRRVDVVQIEPSIITESKVQ